MLCLILHALSYLWMTFQNQFAIARLRCSLDEEPLSLTRQSKGGRVGN